MNTVNEILIESAQLDLLVTEGVADKTKDTFKTVIEKIKEIFNKITNFVKTKLANADKDILEKAMDVIKGAYSVFKIRGTVNLLILTAVISKILGGLHALVGQVAKIPSMNEEKVKALREKLLQWKDAFEDTKEAFEKEVVYDTNNIVKGINSTLALITKGASAITDMASAGTNAAKQCFTQDIGAIYVQTVQLYSSLVAKLLSNLNLLKTQAKSIAGKAVSAVKQSK